MDFPERRDPLALEHARFCPQRGAGGASPLLYVEMQVVRGLFRLRLPGFGGIPSPCSPAGPLASRRPCFEGAGETHGQLLVPVFVSGSALGGGAGRNAPETTHPTRSRWGAASSSSSSSVFFFFFSSAACLALDPQ